MSSSPNRGADFGSEEPSPEERASASRGASERPPERAASDRPMSELLRRVIEAGAKNLPAESVRQLVGELKLPKEVISQTVSQLDETKQGVYRAIGREVHDLFERTNLAEEFAKALSLLSLEIKMEVRFKPSNNRQSGSGVSADVSFKRAAASEESSSSETSSADVSQSPAGSAASDKSTNPTR